MSSRPCGQVGHTRKLQTVTAFFRHRHRIGQDNKRPSAAPGVKSDCRLGQFSSRCLIGRRGGCNYRALAPSGEGR